VSYAPLFRILALDVFFASILQLLTAALLGLRMFKETAAVGLIVQGFARQVLIIVLLVLMRNFVGLVIGWLLSDGAAVAICLWIVVRELGAPRFDFPMGKLFRFYLPL